MRFLLKANELPLWAHFLLFSPSLFFLLHTLVLSNLLCTSSRSTPFTQQYSPTPRQHFIHTAPLSGAARTIRGSVGRAQSQHGLLRARSCPPPRSRSWPQGLNIARELRLWQSRKKTEGKTCWDTRKEDRFRPNSKNVLHSEREETNIIKTLRGAEHESTAERVLQS